MHLDDKHINIFIYLKSEMLSIGLYFLISCFCQYFNFRVKFCNLLTLSKNTIIRRGLILFYRVLPKCFFLVS